MNERIRELYNQARNEVSIRDGILTPGELRDKFAELIVQECIHKIQGLQVEERDETDTNYRHWNQALGHAVLEIEQHFLEDELVDDTEYCSRCGAESSGTSCGLPDCGWIKQDE